MGVQVRATGKGKGKTPLAGKFKVTVTNILTSGSTGDLDFPRTGDGRWVIDWSFVKCPGTSRRLLELET